MNTEHVAIKDLRIDDVVRLRQGSRYRYYGVDTMPEFTGEYSVTPIGFCRRVEFWVTELNAELDPIDESYPECRQEAAVVQVLLPRPTVKSCPRLQPGHDSTSKLVSDPFRPVL